MFPVTCRNLVCKHSFSSDSLDGVNCPVCGETATMSADPDASTVDRSAGQFPSDALDSTWTTDAPTKRGTTDVSAVSMIGRFRVRSKLGAGAFGEVFRALDPQLDCEVALKVAKPGTLDSPERIGRFPREARAAANLRHPNIVPVHDSGKDGDRHYIATGFIDGRTLEAEIEEAEGKPLGLQRAASVIRKLAEALGYAHKQGVIHRDVKPANVLVDRAGAPSLTDFGLAVRARDDAVKTQDGRDATEAEHPRLRGRTAEGHRRLAVKHGRSRIQGFVGHRRRTRQVVQVGGDRHGSSNPASGVEGSETIEEAPPPTKVPAGTDPGNDETPHSGRV